MGLTYPLYFTCLMRQLSRHPLMALPNQESPESPLRALLKRIGTPAIPGAGNRDLMLWFEPFILWLVRGLIVSISSPTDVSCRLQAQAPSLCSVPVVCPLLLRHTAWARFQCPPKRPCFPHA